MMNDEEIWATIERKTGRQHPISVTVAEFSDIMNVSKGTGYRMVADGPSADGIQSTKMRTAIRIPTGEIFRLLGIEKAAG